MNTFLIIYGIIGIILSIYSVYEEWDNGRNLVVSDIFLYIVVIIVWPIVLYEEIKDDVVLKGRKK